MLREHESLIQACIRQERAAQHQLYKLFASKLFATALRYMKNRDDAQDVLQDAFVKIYKHLDSFRFDCPLEAWMRKIVSNTALKAIQKQPTWTQSIDDSMGDYVTDTKANSLSGIAFTELMEMVQSLPDGCRVIFNMYALEGFQHNEIAEMLGINEGTSKSQYSRAKMLLQQKIKKEQQRLSKTEFNN